MSERVWSVVRANVRRVGMAAVICLFLSVFLTGSASSQEPAAAAQAAMSDRLAQEFAAAGNGDVTFLVILKEQADLAVIEPQSGTTQERAALLYPQLTALASASQASLREFLDGQGAPYRAFFIVNMIEVTGDAALAEALRARPEVDRLAANPPAASVLGLDAFTSRSGLPLSWRVVHAQEAQATAALPWGLSYVHAPEVWSLGVKGAGIVVGSQDTGVEWDHPGLKLKYRGWDAQSASASHAYNWFDAFGVDDVRAQRCPGAAASDAQIPCDDFGHGSHTVGTMLGDGTAFGDTVLGVAPDAQWIGCRNMTSGVGTPASYAACFEFFLAPYPQGGDPFADGKPELAAHIINNSWGCPPSEGCDDPNILRQVVETSRAAGQFVVASAGNFGSGCSTVQDPVAIYDDVFSVGAFAESGGLAGFSSRGPVTVDGSGRLKPDLAAPGVGVRSVSLGGGFGAYSSGTSMASPHVAGGVALLWSAFPELNGDVDATEEVLRASATSVQTDLCGATGNLVSPNPLFGNGRLNLESAVIFLQNSPSLIVTVVDTAGVPLQGVVVRVIDVMNSTILTATTDSSGVAVFPRLFTLEWAGSRELTYTLGEGDQAEIYIGLSLHRWLPLMRRDVDIPAP